MRQLVYRPADRPLVEVHVDDTWYPGDLRTWTQLADRTWAGQVTWSQAAGDNRIDTFPAHRIRESSSGHLPLQRTKTGPAPRG